jgi:hypothetical protein
VIADRDGAGRLIPLFFVDEEREARALVKSLNDRGSNVVVAMAGRSPSDIVMGR